jgi:hypothetical protein
MMLKALDVKLIIALCRRPSDELTSAG